MRTDAVSRVKRRGAATARGLTIEVSNIEPPGKFDTDGGERKPLRLLVDVTSPPCQRMRRDRGIEKLPGPTVDRAQLEDTEDLGDLRKHGVGSADVQRDAVQHILVAEAEFDGVVVGVEHAPGGIAEVSLRQGRSNLRDHFVAAADRW